MAINKKLIHFNKKTTFNSQKLSANASNTQYQVGGTGAVQIGAPDINYQSIVYIKDSKEIWTHGQFYGSAASVAWGNVTGKPSWIGSSKPSYSWSEITSKPTLVKQVEPGTPSTDWQSAYVPLDVTYSDTSISHKVISLPMASPASSSSQGRAGLITGADKKKLNDFTDTKNTAGATNSSDRLYLIGATSQGANPQTYSKNGVYIEDDGILMSLQGFEGGAITSTAAIYAANGFFDTSDARVKTNVVEIDASKADAVRLVEFDRTDKKHHGYGVIAQELEKVYPEMVNTDSEGFKSVNYNELAMVKIKYLEDKVARLEALVGRLLAE